MFYFIEGTPKRIFLNTRIGCIANCSYCYLPMLNISSKRTKTTTATSLISALEKNPNFIKGKLGTILSIGCYSECWGESNKQETIRLLELLLRWENPIQVATKMKVSKQEIDNIAKLLNWQNQIIFYISCPTLKHSKEYESGVDEVKNRLKTIDSCLELNIPAVLYIKPILKGITIRDINNYIYIIKKYKIPVVIGESFSSKPNKRVAPVGDGLLFIEEESRDHALMIKEFQRHTVVYRNSSEIVEMFRKKVSINEK